VTSPRGDVLVVAATARELVAPGDGWQVLQCGVGPVDAAAHTAAALATMRPVAILHVGIAGARAAAGIPLGALVIGEAAHYDDLGVGPEWAPRVIAPHGLLLAAARRALPEAHVAVIGTSGRVGGTRTPVEAMEGFAVLRAASLAGVPAIEVRAISNYVEEPDRARWEFARALEAITGATPRLVEALVACVS
jgi:nucleoside phosphorylase